MKKRFISCEQPFMGREEEYACPYIERITSSYADITVIGDIWKCAECDGWKQDHNWTDENEQEEIEWDNEDEICNRVI